ncbi:hypothetical protein Tco_0840482 [Tanacetum coccineum]|uniref:Uncharacterized protein n=1 Tax=Tanacetum coccineum TaxID=301880 RepID=A0ABQ5ATP0_9ASTR
MKSCFIAADTGKDTHDEDADINSSENDKQPLAKIIEKLHKENEHLKQTSKDLYDSIKKTRIQEKVFANVAVLKHGIKKLKGL